MRYLVFGDVHGNLQALDAVLSAGDRRRVDAHLFVGDLVGYGPNPLECIERVSALHEKERLAWVAGNHDLVARGERLPTGYGKEAVETLRWTSELLNKQPAALAFLRKGQPMAKVSGGIWLTHDSLAMPGSGTYHRATQNAEIELGHLAKRGGKVCFYGHTHTLRAELLMRGDAVMLAPMAAHPGDDLDPAPLWVGAEERAWIGTGSAGFPTKKKGAAEYLVLDDTDWSVEKYTVTFSREETRKRVRETMKSKCPAAVVDSIVQWL